jgi:hypothetical protein
MVWRIILWLLCVLAAILLVLIFLPVGIRVRYQHSELKIWYVIGPVRLLRYPEDARRKARKNSSQITIRTVLEEPIKANRVYNNLLGDFLAELKTTLELFWHLRPKLRIKKLMLKLTLAGSDPATISMQYGGAWAAVGAIFPILEEGFVLKKREIDVNCDFSGGMTTLDAKLDISIGLGRLILCLVRYSLNTLEKAENKHIERR